MPGEQGPAQRERDCNGLLLWHHSPMALCAMVVQASSTCIPMCRPTPSLPSPQDVSSQPTAVLCLGLLSRPHIPAPSPCLQQWVIFFILRFILSDMKIATPAFFCFPFAWNIFFHPLTFSLYVSLCLKWVSGRQYIYVSCLCIYSASLCLLVGSFNPFTFKVIIDICVPIGIFIMIWG